MERLSNADMVGDLIAKKVKLYFTYDAISARELNNILDVIWAPQDLFFDIEYPINDTSRIMTVYVGSIPQELHWAGGNLDSWVWKNVTFNLIQR